MSISKIMENARVALRGKWGKGACIVLAYLAVFFVIGFVSGLFGENSLIGDIIEIATAIIQVPIVFGLSYAFIKLKRNEEVNAFDFLDMGFSNFGRSWKIGLRTLLKLIVPFICLVGSLLLILGGSVAAVVFNAAAEIVGSSTAPVAFALLMIVGLILYIVSLIWLAVRNLLYSLTTYIAYDNPNMSSLEVVNASAQMMRGNRGKIFLLELSFIGWAILTVFTLGIGYLWLLPYMQVAYVCFYEYLLGKNENNTSQDNVDAIVEN